MAFERKTRAGASFVWMEFFGRKGDVRTFEVDEAIKRANLNQVSVYSEGMLRITKEGDPLFRRERRDGDISTTFGDIPAGKFYMTCITDTCRSVCMFPKSPSAIMDCVLVVGSVMSLRKGESALTVREAATANGRRIEPYTLIQAVSADLEVRGNDNSMFLHIRGVNDPAQVQDPLPA